MRYAYGMPLAPLADVLEGIEVRVMAGEETYDYRDLLLPSTRAALEEREQMMQARKRELLEAVRRDHGG